MLKKKITIATLSFISLLMVTLAWNLPVTDSMDQQKSSFNSTQTKLPGAGSND